MAFTANDLQTFLHLLEERPQVRVQLRTLLIGDDMLAWAERFDRLTAIVQQLAEAQQHTEQQIRALVQSQQRTEERLERLEATVQTLAEAQQRTEAQVRELAQTQQRTEAQLRELAQAQQRTEEQLRELAQAQQRTEERLERLEATVQTLAEAQQRTEEQLRRLAQAQQRTEERLAELIAWQHGEAGRREGERYERNIARQAPRLFNGGQGGSPDESAVYQHLLAIVRRLPAPGNLTAEQDPFLADLIWWKDDHHAVIEVSLEASDHDVTRAARRAETLRAANVAAIGVVIGETWEEPVARQQAAAQAVQWRVGDDLSDGYLAFCRLRG
jgi:chromosome segregation ATPase